MSTTKQSLLEKEEEIQKLKQKLSQNESIITYIDTGTIIISFTETLAMNVLEIERLKSIQGIMNIILYVI